MKKISGQVLIFQGRSEFAEESFALHRPILPTPSSMPDITNRSVSFLLSLLSLLSSALEVFPPAHQSSDVSSSLFAILDIRLGFWLYPGKSLDLKQSKSGPLLSFLSTINTALAGL